MTPQQIFIAIACAIIALIIAVAVFFILNNKSENGAKAQKGKPQKSNGGVRNGSTAADGGAVEIYVGNLSYDMDDARLHKEFAKFGVIKSARVVINRHNNKSKGYGFVEMPHRGEAEIAIKKLNNYELMGRAMKVNEARRDSRPADKNN